MSMVPWMGRRPQTPEEKIAQLKAVLQRCPNFYPAVLEMGLLRVARGQGKSAEKQVLDGFELMMALAEPKKLAAQIATTFSNLQKFCRYDLCRQILEPAVKRLPRNADLRDSLACALGQLGEFEGALIQIEKAIELEPCDPFYQSNRGWIQLMAGQSEDAERSLREALRIKPGHPHARGNLRVYRYLLNHGGTYLDYLLRPANRKRIDHLANKDRWREADELSDRVNSDRMEAFTLWLMQQGGRARDNIHNWQSTLANFFGFVRELAFGDFPLDEDVDYIGSRLDRILHKFIFKFADADSETLQEIGEGTRAYYECLAAHKLVGVKDLRSYCRKVEKMMPKMIEKTNRYKAVRHDPKLDEDEKEKEKI